MISNGIKIGSKSGGACLTFLPFYWRGVRFLPLLLLAGALFWADSVQAQSEILSYLQKGNFSELQQKMPSLEKKYPHSAMLAYIQAILTPDGQSAFKSYQEFMKKYKDQKWLAPALLRMAQFHYAQGYYISAREEFLQIVQRFPEHPLAPEALYNAALCWTAMASADSSQKLLKTLIRKYPDSSFSKLAQRELKGKEDFAVKNSGEKRTGAHFFVQTGAFSSHENAVLQKQFFEQKGIQGQIRTKRVGSQKLYLVWIGPFATASAANHYGQTLRIRYKVSFRVVEQ